jgi:Spy/CpxP family protein refolding chaperone
MRSTVKAILTASLVLGMAGFALAQRQGPGGFGGPGFLLMNPGVQKELKLSDDQVSKLKDAMGKVREDHKEDFEKIREASPEERQKVMRAVGEETRKAIAGILDAKQMKRLKQIEWQVGGTRALEDPEVQKELKLSDEQKKKLKTIFEDSNKQIRELFQGGNREGAREQFQKLRKDTDEKTNAVLTDEQKKTFKEMKGEPFELQRPGR